MSRIQKLSSFLQSVFFCLTIILPVIAILPWILPYEALQQVEGTLLQLSFDTPEGTITLSSHNWTAVTKSLAILGSIVKYAPLFIMALLLKRLFFSYKQGMIFTKDTVKTYQRLGIVFFINGLLALPISQAIYVLAATLSNPPGHRYLTISIGTPAITDIVCGLIVITISWVMLEGAKLENEQKLTV
jgi:hypothetical protein